MPDPTPLAELRLCRAPGLAYRDADIRRIAGRFGIAPMTLAGLLGQG